MHDSEIPQGCIPYYGFIPQYIDWAEQFSVGPLQYKLFSALLILGVAIRRNAYYPAGNTWVFPNLYLLLLGAPSSFKSSSLSDSRVVLAKANEMLIKAGVFESNVRLILPEDMTLEFFKKMLKERPQGYFPMDEMGGFLKDATKAGFDGILELLTALYDCPPKREIGRQGYGGIVEIEKPFISIGATSTFSWIQDNMTESAMKSGFWPRWLMVPAWSSRDPHPIQPPADKMRRNMLADQLVKIASSHIGAMTFNDKAREIYETWFSKWWQKFSRSDERIGPMYSKLHQYVIKLAIIIELSDGTGHTEIGDESMRFAVNIIDYLMGQYDNILLELGFNTFEQNKNKVVRVLKKANGWVSRATLIRNSHLKARDLNEVIQTLIQSDQIEIDGLDNEHSKTMYKMVSQS